MPLLAVLVVKLKDLTQLHVVMGITKSSIGIRVPKQSVVLVGNHKRHADLCIILEKVLIATLHVKFLTLMLSQSIESLIRRTLEHSIPGQSVTLFLRQRTHAYFSFRHYKILELLAPFSLLQQHISISIVESDFPR